MSDQNEFSVKRRIAILIDGDNAKPSLIKEMLAEVSKYGRTTIRRIYGDWTTPNMNGWKESLHESAVQPVQQFRYTTGKNATDSAMIIDAMDILHSGKVDGFCVVSSDSDYTRLATRIREMGIFVMGIGQQKTPKSFTSACEIFVFTENLLPQSKIHEQKAKSSNTFAELKYPTEILPLLKKAFDLCVQDDGWANLAPVGAALRNLEPTFDYRTFGCSSLKALMMKLSVEVQTREVKAGTGNTTVLIKFK